MAHTLICVTSPSCGTESRSLGGKSLTEFPSSMVSPHSSTALSCNTTSISDTFTSDHAAYSLPLRCPKIRWRILLTPSGLQASISLCSPFCRQTPRTWRNRPWCVISVVVTTSNRRKRHRHSDALEIVLNSVHRARFAAKRELWWFTVGHDIWMQPERWSGSYRQIDNSVTMILNTVTDWY